MQKNKKYWANCRTFKQNHPYTFNEAFNIIQHMKGCKFDESLDVLIRVNTKNAKPSQYSLMLPHDNGNKKKVGLILKNTPDKLDLKEKYGADFVLHDNEIDKIDKKYVNSKHAHLFSNSNVLLKQKKRGHIKNIIITEDIEKAIKNFKSNAIKFKSDKKGNINIPIAKKSFSYQQVHDNYMAVLKEILKTKPGFVKINNYLSDISISTTMSPSVPIKIQTIIRSTKW